MTATPITRSIRVKHWIAQRVWSVAFFFMNKAGRLDRWSNWYIWDDFEPDEEYPLGGGVISPNEPEKEEFS